MDKLVYLSKRCSSADLRQGGFAHLILAPVVGVLVAVTATAYLVTTHANAPTVPATTTATTVVSPPKLQGAFLPSSSLSSFDSATGITANVREGDIAWGGMPSLSDAQHDASLNASDFIGIQPLFSSQGVANFANIANGNQDSYIQSLAVRLIDISTSTKRPVILTLFPEANGEWNVWDGGLPASQAPSPAAYIAAMRHTINVLRSNGVTTGGHASNNTATLVWQVSHVTHIYGNNNITLQDFWPGSSYAAYIGLDGFFSSTETSFTNVFSPAMTAIKQFTKKPIFVASTGALSTASDQAAQVTALVNGAKNSGCIGIVYFDLNEYTLSAQAAAAFGDAIKVW